MEPDLENQPSNDDDLLAVAAYHARDAQAQCMDVSAMAFPSGHLAPSEEMLSAVATKLRALVGGIEKTVISTATHGVSSKPASWNLLSESGFLKEPALIDFVLARFAEDRLGKRNTDHGEVGIAEQLPAKLLTDGEAGIAEAAQAILASESLSRHSHDQLYRELSAELLHQICWHIVAALQIVAGKKDAANVAAAKQLLQQHDESRSGRVAARKLVHFLPKEIRTEALDPEKAGLTLFVASLSAETGLEHDHVLRLIDGHSSAPLATMLRAANIERDAAMAAICLFKGFNLTPHEITIFDNHYEEMSQAAARDAAAEWGSARAKYLAFPDLDQSAPA